MPKFEHWGTDRLIRDYDKVMATRHAQCRLGSTRDAARQNRINAVVDILSTRADAEDKVAIDWLDSTAPKPNNGVKAKASTPKPETKAFSLAVVGPNLADQTQGTFHVHTAKCRDLKQRRYVGAPVTVHDYRSIEEVVRDTYQDIIAEEEDNDWAGYEDEFHFAPCVKVPREV